MKASIQRDSNASMTFALLTANPNLISSILYANSAPWGIMSNPEPGVKWA